MILEYADFIVLMDRGICRRPTDATRYQFDFVFEENLQMGPEFRVSNVSCAPGFSADGAVETKTCFGHEEPYTVTGCTPGIQHTIYQNFCASRVLEFVGICVGNETFGHPFLNINTSQIRFPLPYLFVRGAWVVFRGLFFPL